MKSSKGPMLLPLLRPYFDFIAQARLDIDSGQGSGDYGRLTADQLCERIDAELERIRVSKNEAPELAALLRDGDPMFDDLRAFGSSILASGQSETCKLIGVARRKRGSRGTVQDSDFVEHLRVELQSITPATVERLVVYAVCLGLGYKGAFDEPSLRRIRAELWGHVRGLVSSPRAEHKLSPYVKPLFSEAYNIRTEQLATPPVRWLPVYVACAVALVALVVAVASVMGVGKDLQDAFDVINEAPTRAIEPVERDSSRREGTSNDESEGAAGRQESP